MSDNTVYAIFDGSSNTVITGNLWQYDYGQILIIGGITLPQAFECQFCNRNDGETITQIGGNNAVYIPDQFLQNPEWIDAYIYLHTGENDGETVYKISIPVRERPEPSDITPTPVQQDVITETIAALNEAVDAVPGMIDDALAEAKASGEFDGEDGLDGNGVWWTRYEIEKPFLDRPYCLALVANLKGRPDMLPVTGDLVYGPPVNSGNGDPTYLYRVTELQSGTAVLNQIGSMKGTDGQDGADGKDGVGIPAGGRPGQTIYKFGNQDYSTRWGNQTPEIFDFVYDDVDEQFTTSPSLSDVLAAAPAVIAKLSFSGGGDTFYLPLVNDAGEFFAVVDGDYTFLLSYNRVSDSWIFTEGEIGGGGGGTSDYADLSNKPQINGHTLSGNKSASDLGLGTYSKPSGGIPKTDLASGVQTSLGLADSAYQKPSGGIPGTDLASGVIPSVPAASSSTPQDLGTAAAGSSTDYSRADHVHAKPSASDIGAVASDQGSGNAGKFLVVGNDGIVTPITMATWQGGNY